MGALANSEMITELKLRFWQPSNTGQEFQHYTIEPERASIVAIRAEMLNNMVPETMQPKEREHVSFVYRRIIWTWEDGRITTQALWGS